MARSEFPEKFSEHGKELNRVSDVDPRKLNHRDQQQFRLIEEQKKMEQKKIIADNDRYRDQRIEKEMDRMLRKPGPGMDGPTPEFGGRRVDQPGSPSREDLGPEELRNLRETAERNVRQQEHEALERNERIYTQAQRDLLDRALGPNRYPSRGR